MLVVGALALIGFSPLGPVAGSIAAVIQSCFYAGGVVSGSWFAIAQAIAMASPV